MSKNTKEKTEKIIQKAMDEFGLHKEMVTSTVIMGDIVREFKLDEFATKAALHWTEVC